MPTTIAVVEDDADQRDTYVDVLVANGYAVNAYADKPSAQSAFRTALPDLAILDIMLGQDMDGGFDLCMELRNQSQTVPVIFITARDSDIDRISSQRMMAWDYITKPVSLEFLVARVHALLSIATHLQSPVPNTTVLTINELDIDENSMSIQWQGQRLNFTLTEFQIVESLARRPGHVKTYDALIDVTRQGLVEKNTINGYIRRIRSKFREIDTAFNRIQTVHGTGYKWAQD
ncbi:MAG TPA: response regulator [Gammaproteobacteria bacterium]|jgi:two-component system OmpR family response regulator|nr:response regulator transcription factor [Arenicellales bacterium]MDP7211407.1 response regulator transcription factor [Vicinamibacterales bacterium]HIG14728.1 response regulator [Gammaproteobacteria bacterium]